jgi:hypothetical protein
MKQTHLLILVLLMAPLAFLSGQDSTKVAVVESSGDQEGSVEVIKIDREKWKEVTKDLDYSEDIPREEPPEEEQGEEAPDIEAISNTAEIIKYFLIAIGIGLVVFILYKILTGDPLFARKDKKLDRSSVSYAENAEEEELMEEVLDDALENAEKAGNYRVAMRLLFISGLQHLQDQEHIIWKKEKTNLQYYWEIENNELRQQFKTVSRFYEDAWFGEKPLDQAQYTEQKAAFQQLEAMAKG